MAYFVTNEDGTKSLLPSPNVKVFMKLENPEETYNLFLDGVKEINDSDNIKKDNVPKDK